MKVNKTENSDILIILISLIGYILIFNFYVNMTITNSNSLNSELNSIFQSSDIQISSLNALIITISSITALLIATIYFLINKFLLNLLHIKITSSKLILTVLIASMPCPLLCCIASSLFNIDLMNNVLRIIVSLLEPLLMAFLLKDSFKNKKSYVIYSTILLVLAIGSTLTSNLLK
ncbi:hypothetical protein SAMN04487886_102724 [Clostridium sp. DSM 8431]|uniref:hypothetical protein n=1 Tax=Clostridium sp. DSM 8431 TaxID=1761781 RepID=UPI0008E8D2A1|nr:hypothetical protein [Clostridium sp. DSM 8431]SFU43892.1 hypothetical protein SAMN04487886_102724 [Clostridium sp. DSM 8431]